MILGDFATEHLHQLTDAEIDQYENFINEKDWDIYAWIIGSILLPEKHNNKVVNMIMGKYAS